MIALLTWTNTRGLEYGRIVQNIFTTAKTGALLGLIVVGLALGWNSQAVADNFDRILGQHLQPVGMVMPSAMERST